METKKDKRELIMLLFGLMMYVYVFTQIAEIESWWRFPLYLLWVSVASSTFILSIFSGWVMIYIGILVTTVVHVIMSYIQYEAGIITIDKMFVWLLIYIITGCSAVRHSHRPKRCRGCP